MSKNEYTLLNGSPVELSLNGFKAMMKKDMLKIPAFKEILRFNNKHRFFADMTCIHETKEFTTVTVNYGNIDNVLSDRDMYHEYYSLFLHKNYPLIVNDRILISGAGRVDIVLTKTDSKKDGLSLYGYTRFDSNVPEINTDTRKIKVIRPDKTSDYIKILSRKDHILGEITAPHLSKFSAEELKILRKKGFIDTAFCMFEAWDNVSDEEKTEAYMFQTENEKSGNDIYKDPRYTTNEAITGSLSYYKLEIDCSNLNINESNAVLFENVFNDNICLKRDFPEYLKDQADYWVESSVMPVIVEEEFNISTSLLLTQIKPDEDGKVRIKVINKLINDVRTDHGWHM